VTALSGDPSTGITGLASFTADQLDPILRYHVLDGAVDAATALTLDGQSATTLGGSVDLTVDASGATPVLSVDGAQVTTTDILTSNGLIHVIDAVILPSVADLVSTHPDLGNLTTAASGVAGLVDTLGDEAETFTLLAPRDAAFTALVTALPAAAGISGLGDFTTAQLTPVLNYHLIDGAAVYAADVPTGDVTTAGGTVAAVNATGVTFDDQAVVGANLFASNGVVHLIEGVLLPDIVDIASTTPSLSSLTAAVGAAGLAGTLSGPGPLTLFATGDTAFSDLLGALPAATGITGLADFTVDQLDPILRYHVVDGAVYASQVTAGDVTTLGGTATLSTTGTVAIDGATISTTDILAANGVIHLIDAVLLPSIADVVTTDPALSSLTAAAQAAAGDVPGTLDTAAGLTLFAPTDSAFTALLSANSLAGLGDVVTALGTDGLGDLLTYHVYAGALSPLYASTAIGAAPTTLTMFGGDSLGGTSLSASAIVGDLVLNEGIPAAFAAMNDATVITTDILAANGVIHKIDRVVGPETDPQ
jgi:transforming growth factor-beta-induced protein